MGGTVGAVTHAAPSLKVEVLIFSLLVIVLSLGYSALSLPPPPPPPVSGGGGTVCVCCCWG